LRWRCRSLFNDDIQFSSRSRVAIPSGEDRQPLPNRLIHVFSPNLSLLVALCFALLSVDAH
jgi:hypothetical protein